MYCMWCGAKIDDDAQFCTACGHRVDELPADGAGDGAVPGAADSTGAGVGNAAASGAGGSSAPNVAGLGAAGHAVQAAPAAKGPRSRVPLIVGGSLVVVVLGIGIALAATGVLPLGDDGGQVTVDIVDASAEGEADEGPSQQQGSAGEEDEGESASSSQDAGEDAGAGSATDADDASSTSAPSTIAVDLGSASDREVLNCFITNFSEVPEGLTARSRFTREESPDAEQMGRILSFMTRHMNGNANPYVGKIDEGNARYAEGYRYRVAAGYLTDLLYKYLGVVYRQDELAYADADGCAGTVVDGWFYYRFGGEAVLPSQGVAYVTGVEDEGGNIFRVSYDVYRPSSDLVPTDIPISTYGNELEGLLSAVGAQGTPEYSGTAELEAYRDEGQLAFRLYSMN